MVLKPGSSFIRIGSAFPAYAMGFAVLWTCQCSSHAGSNPSNSAPAGPTVQTTADSGQDDSSDIPRARPVSRDAAGHQSSADSVGGASIQTMASLNDSRKLAIGDRLSFSVVEDEKDPVEVSITDSGEAEIPYIGRVAATDKTCKQLAYQIKSTLEKEFYYQATVLIGLDAAGNRAVSRGKIYVMGEVQSQGPQEIPTDEVYTVSKAILRAGGFGPYANKHKVKLVHNSSSRAGPSQTTIVDVADVMEKGHTDKDPELAPDDLIIVPENIINF